MLYSMSIQIFRTTTDLHQLSIPDSRLVDFLSVKFDILGSTRFFFYFICPIF